MANFPEGLNHQEVTQDAIKKLYNQWVKDWFKDVDSVSELDIKLPRHALYAACWHLDSDPLPLTLAKQRLFVDLRDRLAPAPVGETQQSSRVIRKGKPRIKLYFLEDYEDVEEDYAPVAGEISFRLMDESIAMPESRQNFYADKIKRVFQSDSAQLWRKGKISVNYTDWEAGYQLQILSKTVAEGKSIINRILNIQAHAPNWSNLTWSQNDSPSEAYPTLPATELIAGQRRRLPRRRPIATVRFQYALLQIEGLPLSIPLVDQSGIFPNAIVKM